MKQPQAGCYIQDRWIFLDTNVMGPAAQDYKWISGSLLIPDVFLVTSIR